MNLPSRRFLPTLFAFSTQLASKTGKVLEADTDPANGYSRSTSKGEYWFEK